MSAPLHIDQHSVAGVVVVELSGQLVADEDDRPFKERIESLISNGSRQVLLDVRNLTYMDSGGAGALTTALLHVARRGGALKLLHPSDRVRRVLEVTHLLSVFEVFEDESAALLSFEGSAGAASPAGLAVDHP
jgi:anti-sigma B factor antagonist